MPGTAGDAKADNEKRAKRFQTQYDVLLLGLLAIGLIITSVYGGAAGSCPAPPPQAALAAVNTPPIAAPPATQALASNIAKPTSTPSSTKTAAAAHKPAAIVNPATLQCSNGSVLVGILLALLIALAALAIGAVVGFLFGLPRSFTSSDFRAAAQAKTDAREKEIDAGLETPADAVGPAAARQGSEVNTNLEKISDWLTTIIVGVGLTKLQEIPGGIDAFGERINPYFGYGGKVFGIAGGLFFLIGGFFLAYVGTRVKLSLIFIWSQLRNLDATQARRDVVETSLGADIIPAGPSTPVSDEVKKADETLLSKSLSDLKSPEEVLAWANAKARSLDFSTAVAAYRNVIGKLPVTEKIQTDFAQLLAAVGDTAGANNVVANLATTGITPEAEQEARQKVAAAAQVGRAAALRTRLQQGLYKDSTARGFDDSIAAGEELVKLPEESSDAWVHVWLAAAYGQKHAADKAAAATPPTADQQGDLGALRAKVVDQIRQAIEIDPRTKTILRGLYDPAYRIGDDDDLDSLRPDPQLDAIFQE